MLESQGYQRHDALGHARGTMDAVASHAGTQLVCLIVGPDVERRTLLADAAGRSGWQVVSGQNLPTSPLRSGSSPALAIFDLEQQSGTTPESLKKLVERLARGDRQVLLVLCGNEGNSLEEIWARQLGAWLYLPGVTADSDLDALLVEALTIAARRRRASEQSHHFPPQRAATA